MRASKEIIVYPKNDILSFPPFNSQNVWFFIILLFLANKDIYNNICYLPIGQETHNHKYIHTKTHVKSKLMSMGMIF